MQHVNGIICRQLVCYHLRNIRCSFIKKHKEVDIMPRKAKNYDELELKDDFMFGMVMRNPKLKFAKLYTRNPKKPLTCLLTQKGFVWMSMSRMIKIPFSI